MHTPDALHRTQLARNAAIAPARWIRLALLAAAIAALLLAGHALADEVRTRGTVFIAPDAPVTLAMLATLTGPDAEALAHTIIIQDPAAAITPSSPWIELDPRSIAAILDRAGANTGRLAFTGPTCVIRPVNPPAPEPAPPAPPDRSERSPQPIEQPTPHTIRGAVALAIAGALGVGTDHLRLAFPNSEPSWLDAPRQPHRVLALPRTAADAGQRALVEIRIYDHETLIEERTIRADALVRRVGFALTHAIERGEPILETSLAATELWAEPGAPIPIADPAQIAGTIARKRLVPGALLLNEHIEQPILVRRNQLVRVTAITRGVVVETEAHALNDARLGEPVTLRRAGSTERFIATVEGAARAVVRLD